MVSVKTVVAVPEKTGPVKTDVAGSAVLLLTVGTSPVDFVKKIQQKMCSKLIGVATKLLPNFLF